MYIDLYNDFRKEKDDEKENINDDLVFEKKIITNNTFLNSYFDKIPELIKIQQWIKIKENDIMRTAMIVVGQCLNTSYSLSRLYAPEFAHMYRDASK